MKRFALGFAIGWLLAGGAFIWMWCEGMNEVDWDKDPYE